MKFSKLLFPILIVALLIFLFQNIQAQEKRPFKTEDYPGMLNISARGISENGRFVWYVVAPMQYGDPMVVVHDLQKQRTDTLYRCRKVWFAADGTWMAWIREPVYSEVRAAKLKDSKAAEKFDDTLLVRTEIRNNVKEYVYPALKTFLSPQETGGILVAALLKIKIPESTENDTLQQEELREDHTVQHLKRNGSSKEKEEKRYRLMILDPSSGEEIFENHVVSAEWSPFAKYIVWITQPVDTLPAHQLHLFHTSKKESEPLFLSEGIIRHPAFSFRESELAFLEQPDTSDETTFRIQFCNDLIQKKIIDIEPVGEMVFNQHHPSYFLEQNHKLAIPLAYPTVKPAKDSVLKEEQYNLDIWAWNDPYLQPQQLKQLETEKKRGYYGVYDPVTNVMMLVEDSMLKASNLNRQRTVNIIVLKNEIKYAIEGTWKGDPRADIYLLDLRNGERKLIREGHDWQMILSPDEAFLVWYDRNDSAWMSMEIRSLDVNCITCGSGIHFYDDEYDNPGTPPSYGHAGWGDGGRFLLLNTKYNIWKFDLHGKEKPYCMTSSNSGIYGNIYRIVHLEKKKYSFGEGDKIMLHVFNKITKASGFAEITYQKPGKPLILLYGDYRLSSLEKACKADQVIWQRESYNEFPDIWTARTAFKKPVRLSQVGRQYQPFFRGNCQLVKWEDDDGRWHEGLLTIPENTDGFEKLPMIVTFYERSSDELHYFRHFVPSRSVVNTPYYLSHGYVVFEPDIYYGMGTPGEDALKAVLSGTRYVLSLGQVDPERVGIQGQSWGGYQVAYIITKTNIFAAAMAGAAVSNMTSAYGAIRNESGRARLFQYEDGQSRLGVTLWNGGFQRYYDNSPLFFADQLQTPLLMMHNDNDGAVPWSQSVEFYLALRRLGKPAWLLVYNNESHNLGKWPNRVDLSVRMKQFFDHYLKEAPAPQWMVSGRPALLKGLDDAYRFMD